MVLRTSSYFALAGVVGSAPFYPAVLLMFLGLAPALLLVPIGFMVAGGIVAGRLDLEPDVVRSLAWGFALVGGGVVGSQIGMAALESRTVSVLGGGSMLAGFVAAGLAAAIGASVGLRTHAFLTFAVGGAIAASNLLIARFLLEVRGPLGVAVSVVIGLGVAGALAGGSTLFRPEAPPGTGGTRNAA